MLQIAQIDVPMNSFNNSGRSEGVTEENSRVVATRPVRDMLKVARRRTASSRHGAYEKSNTEA